MINKPEGFLETEFIKKGRIEHQFVAVEYCVHRGQESVDPGTE